MSNIPEFLNGQLMPAIYDDVFKYAASCHDDWIGNDQTIGWVVTAMELNRDDIAEAAAQMGNPRATEAGAIEPGRYLVRQNSDGIVWAYFYPDAKGEGFEGYRSYARDLLQAVDLVNDFDNTHGEG